MERWGRKTESPVSGWGRRAVAWTSARAPRCGFGARPSLVGAFLSE